MRRLKTVKITDPSQKILLATHSREKLGRQNANAIRLAKQKQSFAQKQSEREKERLEEEQALQIKQLAEENRQKLTEAALLELELMVNLPKVTDEFQGTLFRISKHTQQKRSQRKSHCVNRVNDNESDQNHP